MVSSQQLVDIVIWYCSIFLKKLKQFRDFLTFLFFEYMWQLYKMFSNTSNLVSRKKRRLRRLEPLVSRRLYPSHPSPWVCHLIPAGTQADGRCIAAARRAGRNWPKNVTFCSRTCRFVDHIGQDSRCFEQWHVLEPGFQHASSRRPRSGPWAIISAQSTGNNLRQKIYITGVKLSLFTVYRHGHTPNEKLFTLIHSYSKGLNSGE